MCVTRLLSESLIQTRRRCLVRVKVAPYTHTPTLTPHTHAQPHTDSVVLGFLDVAYPAEGFSCGYDGLNVSECECGQLERGKNRDFPRSSVSERERRERV